MSKRCILVNNYDHKVFPIDFTHKLLSILHNLYRQCHVHIAGIPSLVVQVCVN